MNKKILIYARVSTKEQANKGFSLEMQIDRVMQYLRLYSSELSDMPVQSVPILTFEERGGSGKSLERPMMNEVIEEIIAGNVGTLAVYRLDRLTRSVKDLQVILEYVENYKIRLISVTEQIDTRTSVGRFVANQIISIAQLELENIFERTTEGLIGSARKGNYVFRGSPYGYDKIDGKLVINESEAKIVREIFSMVLAKEYSIRAITMILSSRRAGNRKWSEETIFKMLRNHIYVGEFKVRDEIVTEHSPSLINEKMFRETQKILDSRSHLNQYRYLYHSKCFSSEHEELEHKSTTKNNGDSIYLYYVCPIQKLRVNQSKITHQLNQYVDQFIFGKYKRELKKMINTLKWYDSKVSVLTELYESGLIDNDYYSQEIDRPSKNIRLGEAKARELFGRFKKWSVMTDDERHRFSKKHILKIIIDMQKGEIIHVVFNEE
ncbi:recombinase family protein [Erysipelothrix aquatica]|uniref:recombinase family protein n=1 Tax=Erysipelothrix aquatica TaxID=2683714 RepID=UPI00135AA94D|nr:recombinase family protein [Erysipelothrix aquatica]